MRVDAKNVSIAGLAVADNMNKFNKLRRDIPKELLRHWLEVDRLSFRDIQKVHGYDERLISKLSKEYGLKSQYKYKRNKLIRGDIDKAIHFYMDLKMSSVGIAEYFMCGKKLVLDRLRENNVQFRSNSDPMYYESRRKIDEEHKIGKAKDGYMTKDGGRYHRKIVESTIKRELTSDEHVHHIDSDRSNNSLCNLFVFSDASVHLSYHGFIRKYSYVKPNLFVKYYKRKYTDTLFSSVWLYDNYINRSLSINVIAKKLNTTREKVKRHLRISGVLFYRPMCIN